MDECRDGNFPPLQAAVNICAESNISLPRIPPTPSLLEQLQQNVGGKYREKDEQRNNHRDARDHQQYLQPGVLASRAQNTTGVRRGQASPGPGVC